jgi:hypothetical protein
LPEWNGGVRMLDASAPITPTLLSVYDVSFVPRSIAGQAGRLVVGDQGTEGLWAIDAREPAQAAVGTHVELGDGACGADCQVVLQDGVAYLADQNEGLEIVDVRDPGAPRVLSRTSDVRDAMPSPSTTGAPT